MVRVGLLLLLLTAKAQAGFQTCPALLPVALPIVSQSRPCISGVACLRSVATYWGLEAPSEGALGYRILQRAREILGDQEMVRLANIHISYPMNQPEALAAAARDLGLRATRQYHSEWWELTREVARGETVLVLWQLDEDATLRWSAVQAISDTDITLMEPTEGQIQHTTTLFKMEASRFLHAWNDSAASQATVLRIVR